MPSCAAVGCTNRPDRDRVKGITFHLFPKDPIQRQKWIQAVRRVNFNPSMYSYLCSYHFKEEDLDRTSLASVRIRDGAVPSVFKIFQPLKTNETHRKSPTQGASATTDKILESPKTQRQLPVDLAESLITAVQKREALYNVNHESYKNRYMIGQAWKEVAEEVGRDDKFCRSKWGKLRATYNRTLAQTKSQPSGSDPNRAPRWYLFHRLDFLRDYVSQGTGIGYLDTSSAVTLSEAPAPPTVKIELDEAIHDSSSTLSVDDDTTSPSQSENLDFSCKQEDYSHEGTPAPSGVDEEANVRRAILDFLSSDKKHQCSTSAEDVGDDMNLCRGLLLFMKDMTPRNKRIFYQKALSLCNEILDSQD